jgi:hypothetical protein
VQVQSRKGKGTDRPGSQYVGQWQWGGLVFLAYFERMPAIELDAAAIAGDDGADGAVAGAAAVRDDGVRGGGQCNGRGHGERGEEGGEVHCELT